MARTRKHLLIEGLVQGVAYRAATLAAARALGLSGWVRNLYDGRVEALVEGEEEAVAKLLSFCARGPTGARVDRLVVTAGSPAGQLGPFQVVASARAPDAG